MSSLLPWLREWAPLVVLVLLESIIRKSVLSAYRWLHGRIDAKIPDSMPIGAGDWLREEVARRRLDLRIFVAKKSDELVDAFYPSARVITLSDRVDRKHDASFWAMAAHELGHALVYRKNSILHWPLTIARAVQSTTTVTSRMLIIGNILYASDAINALAFQLLTVSLVAYALVLVDELLASGVALHMLARDRRVDRPGFIGAVTALAAAFMTYVGGFTGQVILLLQRDFVVRQIMSHRHFTPGPPMTGGMFVLVGILSVFLVALSVRSILRTLRKRAFQTSRESANFTIGTFADEMARGVVGVIILCFVWDRSGSEIYQLLCIAGVLASRVAIAVGEIIVTLLAKIVLLLLFVLFWWWFVKIFFRLILLFWNPGTKSDYKPPRPTPTPEDARREEALAAVGVELANRPHWYSLAFQVTSAALHIGFVVGIYVSLLR